MQHTSISWLTPKSLPMETQVEYWIYWYLLDLLISIDIYWIYSSIERSQFLPEVLCRTGIPGCPDWISSESSPKTVTLQFSLLGMQRKIIEVKMRDFPVPCFIAGEYVQYEATFWMTINPYWIQLAGVMMQNHVVNRIMLDIPNFSRNGWKKKHDEKHSQIGG